LIASGFLCNIRRAEFSGCAALHCDNGFLEKAARKTTSTGNGRPASIVTQERQNKLIANLALGHQRVGLISFLTAEKQEKNK